MPYNIIETCVISYKNGQIVYLDSIDSNRHVFTYVPDFGTQDYENKILELARIVV